MYGEMLIRYRAPPSRADVAATVVTLAVNAVTED